MITVAICTRERPVLLRRALEYCTKIHRSGSEKLTFIVVENGPEAGARQIVSDFAQTLDIR